MPDTEVIYEIKEGIAYITMNRPEKLNAIDPPMRQLLWDSFQDVKNNPEVRCAIVTGAGRAFSTGHDLVAMASARALGPAFVIAPPCPRGHGPPVLASARGCPGLASLHTHAKHCSQSSGTRHGSSCAMPSLVL